MDLQAHTTQVAGKVEPQLEPAAKLFLTWALFNTTLLSHLMENELGQYSQV